jgi:hypothetical protein
MPERPATPTRWLNASHPMRRSGTKGAPELTEIAAWRRETTEKYHHTVEPVAVAERGGEIIVATKISADFPGSLIALDFVFRLENGKISSLEIQS